jgi:hypothetical protein
VPIEFKNPVGGDPYGTVHVTAAGSSTAGVAGVNTDDIPFFPACLPSDFIVNVGGSKQTEDGPTTESYWGKYSVDLFAPSQTIWATTLNNGYVQAPANGSSYAAAHVSGALAYYFMSHPACSELSGRAAILLSGFANPKPPLFLDKCVTSSRLDMLNLVNTDCPVVVVKKHEKRKEK